MGNATVQWRAELIHHAVKLYSQRTNSIHFIKINARGSARIEELVYKTSFPVRWPSLSQQITAQFLHEERLLGCINSFCPFLASSGQRGVSREPGWSRGAMGERRGRKEGRRVIVLQGITWWIMKHEGSGRGYRRWQETREKCFSLPWLS